LDKVRKIAAGIVSILFTYMLQFCNSDYTVKLGKGYFFRYESENIKDILSSNEDGAEVPATVLEYACNNSVIIAKQRPKLPQDILYKGDYVYLRNNDNIYYWIIIKHENKGYGPLLIEEYKELRNKLKIPVELQLK
jgi:hypothetical protein